MLFLREYESRSQWLHMHDMCKMHACVASHGCVLLASNACLCYCLPYIKAAINLQRSLFFELVRNYNSVQKVVKVILIGIIRLF